MIFGKHINRYYLRHFPLLLLGVLALVAVDYLQLIIPNLYGMVIAGMDEGVVEQGGILSTFDMAFLLDKICMPMVVVIFIIVLGRMVWRVCFLGSSIMMEEDLRNRMFSHNRELSREYTLNLHPDSSLLCSAKKGREDQICRFIFTETAQFLTLQFPADTGNIGLSLVMLAIFQTGSQILHMMAQIVTVLPGLFLIFPQGLNLPDCLA